MGSEMCIRDSSARVHLTKFSSFLSRSNKKCLEMFFASPWGAPAPPAPPDYAYGAELCRGSAVFMVGLFKLKRINTVTFMAIVTQLSLQTYRSRYAGWRKADIFLAKKCALSYQAPSLIASFWNFCLFFPLSLTHLRVTPRCGQYVKWNL